MLRIALIVHFCLASASAAALPNDFAAIASYHLIGQAGGSPAEGSAIERELSGYLDVDDMDGAYAFVGRLSADGAVDEAERRALEERIWRTKTERTLQYARKIREAIENSDLETMRAYNARMQRLMAKTAGDDPSGPLVDEDAGAEPVETDIAAAEPERSDEIITDTEDAAGTGEVIADLLRRGEDAIARYNLTVASPGTDSAIGMLDQLMALGKDGETGAKTLGRKIMAVYAALIEKNIGRGRLDKALIFTERMGMVAERAGLPLDEIHDLRAQIDQISAKIEEHERLLRQAARLRDRGQLAAPGESHALSFAAKALLLDVDRKAANRMLDGIIQDQRLQADQLAKAGRLRDAARELETLATALRQADIEKPTLTSILGSDAADLYRRADLRDSERERQAAAAAASEDDEDDNPLTFINPF